MGFDSHGGYRCLECKIIFRIDVFVEKEYIPEHCFKCKWLRDNVCWFENDEYNDYEEECGAFEE